MNLSDLTDDQTTTKKMRAALRRGEKPAKEIERLSKRKNPNPDPKSNDVSGNESPDANEDEINVDAMSSAEV